MPDSTNNSIIQTLENRQLIAQVTSTDELESHLQDASRTIYCGFDPTADSLHLGHLVPLLILRRFQQQGHRPIALVGGATGLIGDPSFKDNERQLNPEDVVELWSSKIKKQVSAFIDFDCGNNSAIVANNIDWVKPLNTIDFLRSIGKHFSVNMMIKRESVQQRINRSEYGISFTEFSYTLLQGLDFLELNSRYGCTLQVGGSDQWGNIISGIDLCKKKNKANAFGLTVPLITKSDGTKFGKTESGTIWLDPQKTSPYAFYQFWLNIADADVYRMLKLFTFLDIEQIQQIELDDQKSCEKPKAQRILAEEVTKLVHGEQGLESAKRISKNLFLNKLSSLTENDLEQLKLDGLPSAVVKKQDITDKPLTQLLSELSAVKSGKQAKDMLIKKAILINNKACSMEDNMDLEKLFASQNAIHEKYFLIKTGKKNHFLIKLENR